MNKSLLFNKIATIFLNLKNYSINKVIINRNKEYVNRNGIKKLKNM